MPVLNERLLQEAIKLHEQNRFAEAEAAYDRLLKSNPNDPHLLHFKGLARSHQGDPAGAADLFQRAISISPANADFYHNLGLNLEQLGDRRGAAQAYSTGAGALLGVGRSKEALAAYDRSLALVPDERVRSRRSVALEHLGNPQAASEQFRRTLARLKKEKPSAHTYLEIGNLHSRLDEWDQAFKAYQAALKIKPDFAMAQFAISPHLLRQGKYAEGWQAHEWRWHPDTFYGDKARVGFSQPVWQGENPSELAGPLLVLAEQSFGDNIHFARFAPILADMGYDVLFEVQQKVYTLLKEGLVHPRIRVIPRQYYRWDKWHLGWLAKLTGQRRQLASPHEIFRNLPFKAWIGSMSVPERLGTTLETIPAAVPYLTVKPHKVEKWRRRFAGDGGKFRIGMVWSGEPNHPDDFKRSVPAEKLYPLLQRQDATFYSLQVGERADHQFPAGMITKLDGELTDFTETAAAMLNLDLIITVDTAPAHLAGALNRPVWLMLPKVKDWRWGTEGETSPWYPSMRLFRHPSPNDWEGTVANVNRALDGLLGLR